MRYFALLPLALLANPIAWLLAPILPLFADRDTYLLPRWLWWFQTPDNNLMGDTGHDARWSGKKSYWRMVSWLIRNPAYGFDAAIGADIKEWTHVTFRGNPWITNRTTGGVNGGYETKSVPGWLFVMAGDSWCFKLIAPLIGNLGIMWEFGWKLQPLAQGRREPYYGFVFSPRFTVLLRNPVFVAKTGG